MRMLSTSNAGLAHVRDLTIETWPEDTVSGMAQSKLRATVSGMEFVSRRQEGMMTRSCLKSKPSRVVSSWRTDQYGRASSGTAALSFGHPSLIKERRMFCSESVEVTALMSRRVASWKPERSGVLDSNSTR